MENTEVTETKKFNKANLPFFIAIGMFIIGIILPFVSLISSTFITFTLIFYIISIFLIPLLLITGLILQILHKKKSLFDKIMLALNSIIIFFILFLIVLAYIAFPNAFVKDKDVKFQIDTEISTLNKEYQPVLNYLAKYKKDNGVYPDKIEEKILPKSKTFDKFEYHVILDKKGYWLQVYPINGPIEYYYNDENDSGYNFYNGNGYIDGFLDNDNYYEIDKTWHAVRFDLFTRHSIFWNNEHPSYVTDRKVDEWMKDNVEKLEQLEKQKGKK